jgi:hypothetical protein
MIDDRMEQLWIDDRQAKEVLIELAKCFWFLITATAVEVVIVVVVEIAT